MLTRIKQKQSPRDTEALEDLLRQAQAAKQEALQFNRSGRDQLIKDVKHLHALLQEAKVQILEGNGFKKKNRKFIFPYLH